jgi:CheY-like chemotaxis protein
MTHRTEYQDISGQPDNARVLLAEDSEEALEVMSLLLEGLGYEVTPVTNGKECMDAVQRADSAGEPFDLVFLDIRMPLVDGNEAAVALRTTGYQNPLIAITADASLAGKLESTFSGFDAYVSKRGLDQGLLSRIIKEVCSKSGGRVDPM